jgi:arylformamidase
MRVARRRQLRGACVLLFAVSAAAERVGGDPSCDFEPAVDLPYRAADGVNPLLLSADVAPAPAACGAPVAVWVHGGSWRGGDKGDSHATRVAFYNAAGWMLVSINYRLSTPLVDPPVTYPDHNEDVAAAIAWVHEHIGEHGGDPSTVLLVGHSAGATIAASVAVDPTYLATHGLAPSALNCVVLLDPAGLDIAAIARTSDLYPYVFGNDPDVWRDASPPTHVGAGPLPARVLLVVRGSEHRRRGATEFADQLRRAGSDAVVADVDPRGHDELEILISSGDEVMGQLMLDELDRCADA